MSAVVYFGDGSYGDICFYINSVKTFVLLGVIKKRRVGRLDLSTDSRLVVDSFNVLITVKEIIIHPFNEKLAAALAENIEELLQKKVFMENKDLFYSFIVISKKPFASTDLTW